VAFVQRFGSALQLTPHFHLLVPEAVFEEVDEAELRSKEEQPGFSNDTGPHPGIGGEDNGC